MMTFEEAQDALDDFIAALPQEIFKGLNCGVALVPDVLHDHNGLLVLGQYHYEPRGLGRYITINYGSLMAAHGYLPPDQFAEKLKKVLHHELTHHLEHQAGDRSLEIEDAKNIQKMLMDRKNRFN
ncbi:MAG: hypothetical protein FWC71_05520 [Defluviitaleaceae bacterium]|nr:hypothetical protein [Defluviitaleaceae bacterium]